MKRINDFLVKNKDSQITRLLFVFVLSMALGWVTVCIGKNLSMFKSDKAESDFLMNHYFSYLTKNYFDYEHCDSVFLLDVFELNRERLAEVIEYLDSMQPKVIGLDVLHLSEEIKRTDSLLVQAINNCKSTIVLPLYSSEYKDTLKPFYIDRLKKPLLASVNFDEPWYNKTKQGKYDSFAYSIANSFCGNELDTCSFLVDYEPMNIYQRIKYDTTKGQLKYIDTLQNGGDELNSNGLKGKIVLVGTLNRFVDPISLDFPIKFQDDGYSDVVPGMIALTYQIRSFLDIKHQIKKMGDFCNGVCSLFGLLIYILLCLLLSRVETKLEFIGNKKDSIVKRKKVLKTAWVVMPLLKMVWLLAAEYLLVLFYCWMVHKTKMMPDLWLVMASLPYVNCTDLIFSRLIEENKRKM